LLQKHTNLTFDIVLIDEAHNLIENDSRDILTVQDLKILKKRNTNIKFYYFTPFLISPENLKIFPNEELLVDKIHEFIKVEKYFVFDLTSSKKFLKIYDQFINDFINIKSMTEIDNSFEFINKYAANKNIIYLNKPKDIEEFSTSISGSKRVKPPKFLSKTSLNLQILPDKFLNCAAFKYRRPFFVSNKNIFSAGIFTPCNKVDVVTIYLISFIFEKELSTYKRTFSGIPPWW
jgi:hypothetical protein